MSYAETTSVPIDRSQGEIRKILSKYGATGFVYGETGDKSIVMFEMLANAHEERDALKEKLEEMRQSK